MKHSTLYSFGFAKYDSAIPPVVLNLFVGYENMTVNGEPVFNYTLEVFDAVLNDRIDLKHFNLIAFIRAIQKNNDINKEKAVKKITYFKPESATDESDGIVESHIKTQEDLYAEFDENNELQWAVDKINDLLEEYINDYGVHLIHVMKKAAEGFPQAVKILRNLCDEVETLSELVYIILNSGQSLDELFPENEDKKPEIIKEVEKVIEEREASDNKVVSINRVYGSKDENIKQMKKMGLDAYRIGYDAYIAFESDKEKEQEDSRIVNY